jgi:hypothetical protein
MLSPAPTKTTLCILFLHGLSHPHHADTLNAIFMRRLLDIYRDTETVECVLETVNYAALLQQQIHRVHPRQ